MHLQRAHFVVLSAAALHPQHEELQRLALEDIARLGLLTEKNKRRAQVFNTLTGHVYPSSALERVRIAALWCNWLYFFDDAHDELEPGAPLLELEKVRASAERSVEVLRLGHCDSPTPLDGLGLEFRERALALMGDAWLQRFCDHARDYLLLGTLPACRHWLENTTPQLAPYLVQRDHDSAVMTALALIELCRGLTLEEAVVSDPDFLALNAACTRNVALFNDIASYPKEVIKARNPNNLVHVLSVERGKPFADVLDEAVEFVNDAAREIERRERALLLRRPDDLDLASYLDGIRQWQRGNIEMSLSELRYRTSSSPFTLLRPTAPPRPPARTH